MIVSVGAVLFWFAWIGVMTGLLIWAIGGFLRTHTWYVALLGAGAACHLVAMACAGADAGLVELIPGLRGVSHSLPRTLSLRAGDVWLLGTFLLIIGGLAF